MNHYYERYYVKCKKSYLLYNSIYKLCLLVFIANRKQDLLKEDNGFLFFNTFFLANRAELRQFFGLLPVLFSFFIPALSMRSFAEEKKSTSLETLLTLPVTVFDVVAGKFLAVFISGLVLLIPSLFYVLTCFIFGSPDAGPILGGYLGSIFLTAGFSAIGIFASSTTKKV